MSPTIRQCGDGEIERVWRLAYEVYREAGYCGHDPTHLLRHYPWLDGIPETTVLIATDHNDDLLATCSLTEDKPWGLHVDEDFPNEMRAIRSEPIRQRIPGPFAAAWRIVSKCTTGMAVIRKLMCEVADRIDDDEVLWIDCNPRHERFYQRVWGFQRVAGPKTLASVNGAQAVLLMGTGETFRGSRGYRK